MDYNTLNLIFRCNKEFGHRQIRGRDLTDTEFMICSYVCVHPRSSQDEVAAALKTDKTSIAKSVASLEAKKLISRRQDDRDRRIKRLRVTAEGRRRLDGLMEVHDAWLTKTLGCLNEEERAQFEDYCRRILQRAMEPERSGNAEKPAE